MFKKKKHTSWFTHGDRFNKVLWSHVQLSFILHRSKHAETMLMGGHVHISILKVRQAILET